MSIEFNNVTIDVLNKNRNYKQKHLRIINNVSGVIRSGKLTAIMGPSGGGKTTLINCLAGRIPSGSITSGSVLVDGQPRKTSDWMHKSAYLDQDDHVSEMLTVEETIRYAAQFRLRNTSKDQIDRKVHQMLQILKLSEVSKNQMKSLSGGQRKRALIGVELITDPQFIFLDEPTSGLDTNTANSLIKFLKGLAEQGKTVVFSIHQPSLEAFLLFDEFMLVCKSKIAYLGKPMDIEKELNNLDLYKRDTSSLPDFIMEITNNDSLENDKNIQHENAMKQLINIHENSFANKNVAQASRSDNEFFVDYSLNIQHLMLLMSRRMKIECKSPIRLVIRSVLIPLLILCIFIPIMKPKDEYIYGWFCVLFLAASMVNVLPASTMLQPEGEFIRREIGVSTYSTTSYYLSIYLYQLIKNLVRNIVPCIYLIILAPSYNSLKLGIVLMYVVIPFIGVFIGMIFGSITRHKKLSIMLSSLSVMCLFTVCILFIFRMRPGPKLDQYLYYTAASLVSLLTPFNLLDLLFAISPKEVLSSEWLKFDFKFTLMYAIDYNLLLVVMVNVFTFILYAVAALLLFSRVLRPSLRMDLSKKQ